MNKWQPQEQAGNKQAHYKLLLAPAVAVAQDSGWVRSQPGLERKMPVGHLRSTFWAHNTGVWGQLGAPNVQTTPGAITKGMGPVNNPEGEKVAD